MSITSHPKLEGILSPQPFVANSHVWDVLTHLHLVWPAQLGFAEDQIQQRLEPTTAPRVPVTLETSCRVGGAQPAPGPDGLMCVETSENLEEPLKKSMDSISRMHVLVSISYNHSTKAFSMAKPY